MATWTYRAVVLKLRWPSRTWMVRRSVPDSSKWVAKLCRRVWTVTCLPNPASWRARQQTLPTAAGGDGLIGHGAREEEVGRPGGLPVGAEDLQRAAGRA